MREGVYQALPFADRMRHHRAIALQLEQALADATGGAPAKAAHGARALHGVTVAAGADDFRNELIRCRREREAMTASASASYKPAARAAAEGALVAAAKAGLVGAAAAAQASPAVCRRRSYDPRPSRGAAGGAAAHSGAAAAPTMPPTARAAAGPQLTPYEVATRLATLASHWRRARSLGRAQACLLSPNPFPPINPPTPPPPSPEASPEVLHTCSFGLPTCHHSRC